LGPLISEHQRQRVLTYIKRGVAEGARVALGGGIPWRLPRGWFVEPTVLADVGENDVVAQVEIFGPVITVIPYEGGDDEAVRIANNSRYGLSGAVISASAERAGAVARKIRTGTMSVNGGVYYGADMPFGGYRQSGSAGRAAAPGSRNTLRSKPSPRVCKTVDLAGGTGMSGTLSGKRVVVIGASAGIGRALAVRAVQEGAQVLMAARRGAELEKAADEAGGGHPVTVDVRAPEDCARLAGPPARHWDRSTSWPSPSAPRR